MYATENGQKDRSTIWWSTEERLQEALSNAFNDDQTFIDYWIRINLEGGH